MSRSIYSLNALLLDNPGLFIPHAEDEFYPNGPVAQFDQAIMLGYYEPVTYYRELNDTTTVAAGIGQREEKVIEDTVRLSDWVDALLRGEPWTEQSGTSTIWTES